MIFTVMDSQIVWMILMSGVVQVEKLHWLSFYLKKIWFKKGCQTWPFLGTRSHPSRYLCSLLLTFMSFLYQDNPRCESDEFACDGRCHSSSIKCNGLDECLDGLDEENCPVVDDQRPQPTPVKFTLWYFFFGLQEPILNYFRIKL